MSLCCNFISANMNSKNVLITGGTCGIGRELARIFAREGYNIVLVARSEHELLRTAEELRTLNTIHVLTLSKDLFAPHAAFELYDELRERNIQVDVLVNNAGQGNYGLFVDTDLEKELKMVQLNVLSLMVLTKLFLRDMVTRGKGRILNLSSVASKSPGPWQAVYHATKAFVQSFTEALHQEVLSCGVTVTALLPGATATDFFRKANMERSKLLKDRSQFDDPATVAQDGFDALMAGKDMVVSGFANKREVFFDALTPDAALARQTSKMQEPVDRSNP